MGQYYPLFRFVLTRTPVERRTHRDGILSDGSSLTSRGVCAVPHRVVVSGSCRPAQESARLLTWFFYYYFKTDVLCASLLVWHSFKCNARLLLFVQTKPSIASFRFEAGGSKTTTPRRAYSHRRLATQSKRHGEQSSRRELFPRCSGVSESGVWFVCTRGVSYFHTSWVQDILWYFFQ